MPQEEGDVPRVQFPPTPRPCQNCAANEQARTAGKSLGDCTEQLPHLRAFSHMLMRQDNGSPTGIYDVISELESDEVAVLRVLTD